MIYRTIGLIAALACLAACEDVIYKEHRLTAKYEYDGVRYDVYDAVKVDEGTPGPEGSSYTSETAVKRLVREGEDPTLDETSGTIFGASNVIVNCEGTFDECCTQFGAALEKRKNGATEVGDGGMY